VCDDRRKLLFYDGIADTFDSVMNRYDLARRLEIVFDELLAGHDLAGRRVLDVGSGTGWFSRVAVERGARVVALDIGVRLLAKVREKCPALLAAADACALPFRDDTFDVVMSSECIEHTLDPKGALREMGRVLRPAGTLVVTVPNQAWHWSATLAAVFKLRPYEGLENWVSWRELQRELREMRLQIDTIAGFHLFPPLLRPTWPLLRFADRFGAVLGPVMLNLAAKATK